MINHLKILIAEDSVEFNKDKEGVFNKYGFDSYFTSKDGVRVIEKIEKTHPDIVILDLFMARADAIAVIKNISNNNNIITPIFIVLSNFTSPVLEKEVMEAGASYFIIKPFNIESLAERIIGLVRNKKFGNHSKPEIKNIHSNEKSKYRN